VTTFEGRVKLPVPAPEAFAWHERPGALERMTPPWERVRVVTREGTIRDGDRVVLELGPRPLALRLEHVHEGYVPGVRFRDRQVRGPFARFVHTHEIVPLGPERSMLEDTIDYALPLGRLGRVAGRAVRSRIERAFAYRHTVLANDLARHARVLDQPRLRIAITGASGMIGAPLATFLSTGGHEVVRLVRRAPGPGEIAWNPARGELDARQLEGVDAVIHLAGENVGRRWTADRKRRILASRIEGTTLLARALAGLARPPRVLVAASAIGIYGAHGDGPVDETSPSGDDFLAEVCRRWEAAAEPAREAGIRVVDLRIGVVLAASGGALAQMLPVFRLGAGGPLGAGRQHVSWISLDDSLYAIHHALVAAELAGPVNAVAPRAVTNAELAATLARVLRRPARLRVPPSAIELAFGEMGRLAALGGVEVRPRRLRETGFAFAFPELEPALRHALGRAPGILRA
jgi:uncharacterized protein